jgi:hypothetical protein
VKDRLTRDEVFEWMRGLGWTWDGVDDEDPDGMFTKEGQSAISAELAEEFLRGWRHPGNGSNQSG